MRSLFALLLLPALAHAEDKPAPAKAALAAAAPQTTAAPAPVAEFNPRAVACLNSLTLLRAPHFDYALSYSTWDSKKRHFDSHGKEAREVVILPELFDSDDAKTRQVAGFWLLAREASLSGTVNFYEVYDPTEEESLRQPAAPPPWVLITNQPVWMPWDLYKKSAKHSTLIYIDPRAAAARGAEVQVFGPDVKVEWIERHARTKPSVLRPRLRATLRQAALQEVSEDVAVIDGLWSRHLKQQLATTPETVALTGKSPAIWNYGSEILNGLKPCESLGPESDENVLALKNRVTKLINSNASLRKHLPSADEVEAERNATRPAVTLKLPEKDESQLKRPEESAQPR